MLPAVHASKGFPVSVRSRVACLFHSLPEAACSVLAYASAMRSVGFILT